jgi:hypothetical protein
MSWRLFSKSVSKQNTDGALFKEPKNRFQGIDSASLCSLAESLPWNRFLGSLNIYKFGLRYGQVKRGKLALSDPSYTKLLAQGALHGTGVTGESGIF